MPGLEGCPCSAPPSECAGDLVCTGDVCMRLPSQDDSGGGPPPPDQTSGSDDGGGESGGGEAGGGACSFDLDCLDSEVCVDSVCSDVWGHSWSMEVEYFEPVSCVEDIGDLDPDYLVWRGFDLLTDSPEDGCPSSWPGVETIIEPFEPNPNGFVIDFWDNDFFTDPEHICTWGWDSLGIGDYGPIPKFMLHDGFWFGSFYDDACYAEISFTLVE